MSCTGGLQGFPVNINGLTPSLKESIKRYNDVFLQFKDTSSNWTYNTSDGTFFVTNVLDNDTFFIGATQFLVKSIRLSKQCHAGYTLDGQTLMGELQIWGTPTSGGAQQSDAGVLAIPIIRATKSNTAGDIFHNIYKSSKGILNDIFYKDNLQLLRYTTCISVRSPEASTKSVSVAYFLPGLLLTQTQINILPSVNALKEKGIPQIIFPNTQVYTSINNDNTIVYGAPTNNIFNVYVASIISANTDVFKSSFFYVTDFKKGAPSNNDDLYTNTFRCMNIDRNKDIIDGKIYVDPSTGQRMDDELKAAEEELKASTNSGEEPSVAPSRYIPIILAMIIAPIAFGILMYILWKVFGRASDGSNFGGVVSDVLSGTSGPRI
jgi:hypothetical protein